MKFSKKLRIACKKGFRRNKSTRFDKKNSQKKLQRFNYDAKEYLGPKKKTIEEPTHKTYKITQI